MNGAEILVRCIANCGGFQEGVGIGDQRLAMRTDCSASHVYGIYSNSQGSDILINGKRQVQNASGGGSMIIDPFGRVLIETDDSLEAIVHSTIPIASFRAKHKAPRIRTEIYAPVLEQHPGRFPPNLYSDWLPTDMSDALRRSLEHKRW
jgi:predicted amidohydrolase